MSHTCRICGNSSNHSLFTVREMQFGFRDEFEYFECNQCGSLLISEIPQNLDYYYPANYFSFPDLDDTGINPLKYILQIQRTHYILGDKRNLTGKLLNRILGSPSELSDWAKKAGLKLQDKILDVGSGTGKLVNRMRNWGFSDLTGIDPFLQRDIFYRNGVRVLKKDLSELDGEFDFIMLHHSIEHIAADPLQTFQQLNRLTKNHRLVLICTPLVPSYTWRKYQANWMGLDAPRHLQVYSQKGMEILAHQTGFEIEAIDNEEFTNHLWGSEQYLRDIPYMSERSYLTNPQNSIFSQADMAAFEQEADRLKQTGEGDFANYYLRKIK